MDYRNSAAFEEAILGCHSNGSRLKEQFWDKTVDFNRDVSELISKASAPHPATRLGLFLYRSIKHELERRRIDTEGFIFLPTINTIADARLWTDAVVYLPSVHRYPVTIDLFNSRQSKLMNLRNGWIRDFGAELYSELDFQTDLFRYNKGFFAWVKQFPSSVSERILRGEDEVLQETSLSAIDFRQCADYGRPENHVILTPYHTANCRRRREFARMVAEYLAGKVPGHKMAQRSR